MCALTEQLEEAREMLKESDAKKPIWDRLDSLAEKQGALIDKLIADAVERMRARAEMAEKHSAALCTDLVAAHDAWRAIAWPLIGDDGIMLGQERAVSDAVAKVHELQAMIRRLSDLLGRHQYEGTCRNADGTSASLACVGCGTTIDMRDALAGRSGVCEPQCHIAAALKDAKEMVP